MAVEPNGVERFFDEGQIIVSKTDTKGIITYANDVFLEIADYTEEEVIGQPHSMIRHPDMPRCIFKLLWDRVSKGKEIFAYVMNMTKGGGHYWVLAHVTPMFDSKGKVVGYHSNRRVPEKKAVDKMRRLYSNLSKIEASHKNRKSGLTASYGALVEILEESGVSYDEFILTL